MFNHVPYLRPHLSNVDQVLEDWKQYKLAVPTYGAIIISAETPKHVLLVQSYFAKSSWGFPKGKINEHEDPAHCAIREVHEETGFDITNYIKPNDYIELMINFQYTRLYLITGVPIDTKFAPRTRKEIKCCEWFPVDLLPSNKYQMDSKTNLGIGPNSFFMILPFIKRLKKWLAGEQTRSDKKVKAILQRSNSNSASIGTTSNTVNNPNSNKKNRMNPNISNYHYEAMTPKDQPGTFFPLNQKLNITNNGNSANRNRQRHKSMGEVESGGFKLANFDLPVTQKLLPPPLQQSTPKESRRKLVFGDTSDKFEKILERSRPIKPFEKFALDKIKVWTNFKLDKQRLITAMGM